MLFIHRRQQRTMFRPVAMLWRPVPERQDVGTIANMIPAVKRFPATQVNGMRRCIADSRQLQAEFRPVFESGRRLLLLTDCNACGAPSPIGGEYLYAPPQGRQEVAVTRARARIEMLGYHNVDCDRAGRYGLSSLDASVADNDLCDRRLDRFHGGVGRREL
jgi:hypothetical protein